MSGEACVRRLLIAALVAAMCVTPVAAQVSAAKAPAQVRLDERVPVWLKVFHVTSVAVAWIEHGQVAWTAVYGEQVPGGPPANAETLYNVASLTKPITAEVILRLASAGKLSLDEPMAAYWVDPDIAQNPWSKKLTARICLEHETGFPNWRYQTNNVLTFKFEPGTAFGYSGEGFNYMARYAEKRTGEGFEQLAQQTVFGPMGMKETSYTPREWWKGRQASPVEAGNRTNWNAADLLRTAVGDYARFVVGVMHDSAVSQEIAKERMTIHRNLLTPEQESVLCEAAKDPAHCTVQMGMGLGWRVVKVNGATILDHTGGDVDVQTFAFLEPERGVGAVIFTDGPNVGNEMLERVLGVLYPDPVYVETVWGPK